MVNNATVDMEMCHPCEYYNIKMMVKEHDTGEEGGKNKIHSL